MHQYAITVVNNSEVLYPEPPLVCLQSVVASSCPTVSDEESGRMRITMEDACYIKHNHDSLNSDM